MYNDNKFFSILALISAQNQRKNLHFIKKTSVYGCFLGSIKIS